MIYTNLEQLLSNDLMWRKMAKKFTKCEILADELVHQFYLAYQRIKESEPNKIIDSGYVYVALNNLFLKDIRDLKRESKQLKKYTLDNSYEDYDLQEDINKQSQIDFLLNKLDGVEWFHRTIFQYVIMEGVPMRKLARDTGIHFNIIQKSVADTKKYLTENFNNEFRTR